MAFMFPLFFNLHEESSRAQRHNDRVTLLASLERRMDELVAAMDKLDKEAAKLIEDAQTLSDKAIKEGRCLQHDEALRAEFEQLKSRSESFKARSRALKIESAQMRVEVNRIKALR